MSMPNKPTSARMKPKKLDTKKKVDKGTKPPVTKKKSAVIKKGIVGLKGKMYDNGQA
jgi:hypothetical protein